MRFLRLMYSGRSIFKKIRIAFTLLNSSFESFFFSHQHYFLLCILLAAIQFIYMKIIGLIHYRLTLGFLIKELLAGENFFEILWHNAHFTISADNFFSLLALTVLLYLEIILILFVLSASSHYTFKQQNNSIRKSLQTSLTHWRAICTWGLLELCTLGSSSLLGDLGGLLYFVWNIITIFDVQILSFDNVSAYGVIKKSWKLFKQNFSKVVVFDIIIEGLLIIAGLILYFISRQHMPSTSIAGLENYSDIIIFLTLYLISSVMVFEVVIFTKLYKTVEKNNKNPL